MFPEYCPSCSIIVDPWAPDIAYTGYLFFFFQLPPSFNPQAGSLIGGGGKPAWASSGSQVMKPVAPLKFPSGLEAAANIANTQSGDVHGASAMNKDSTSGKSPLRVAFCGKLVWFVQGLPAGKSGT